MNKADTSLPCTYPKQDDIVFTKQDSRKVINPYNDALVIIPGIANKKLYTVLVDTEASCNLLEYSAFKKMKLLDKDLEPVSALIYGITGDSMRAKRMIWLLIILGTKLKTATSMAKFIVVNT